MEKVVFITGASRGIGFACARLFAEEGYTVFGGFYNTPEPLERLADELSARGLRVIPVHGNVSSAHDVARMFERATHVDVLINNAGAAQFMPFSDMSECDWDEMMAVNLKSVFLCTKAVVPDMIRRQSGCIVNISSVWGITGGSCESHYSAAKAGVVGLTRALAKELGPSGIRVNCIAPGVIDTDMTADLTANDRRAIIDQTPLECIGSADDIAKAALFLARDGGFVTGEVLQVNGGFYI